MKRMLWLCAIVVVNSVFAQSKVESYFNKIRNNEAALTAFFTQMPKGGDLHHHFSGSIYAEPILKYAIEKNCYINTVSFQVIPKKPTDTINWLTFKDLEKRGELEAYKEKIMRRWSVKDYHPSDYPSDKLFFESFDKFWPVGQALVLQGLQELKQRAIAENVSYIETQLHILPSPVTFQEPQNLNAYLRKLAAENNEKVLFKVFDSLKQVLERNGALSGIDHFNQQVQKVHDSLQLDNQYFTLRYQNFVLRFFEPIDLFGSTLMAFASANKSALIVGINIVSPEDGEVSLKDYALHMQMFKYFHQQYPNVTYAMHAGELTMGLVMPEELTYHIYDAVNIAGAKRIGHGVDIAYEKNSYQLLKQMAKNKIAIEINPVSNEFILKVKDDKHPIMLYHQAGVPIVIGSDDAGILRTNLSQQFVVIAKRYPQISYETIKKWVYNSIQYSFIEEASVKQQLLTNLNERFNQFEKMIINMHN